MNEKLSAAADSAVDRFASPLALATDLDGTLLPLNDSAQHARDLRTLERELQAGGKRLVFVTGRHLASVQKTSRILGLPRPAFVICDVGASIYRLTETGDAELVGAYHERLDEVAGGVRPQSLRVELSRMEGLRPQEDEKQGPFKLSFYCDGPREPELTQRVRERLAEMQAPCSVVSSLDPFNGDGLVDVLPRGANKAFALAWWREAEGLPESAIVYAGDSGNDWDAMVAGYRTIVVGNADRRLAERVAAEHSKAGWTGRLHLAAETATSGVLEGWRAFSEQGS